MIKAIIFDFFGVLEEGGRANKDLLKYIKPSLKSKYKLAILSNSSGGWMNDMLASEEIALFDAVVLSAEEGIAKPDPEIYLLTAKKLGCKPAECVYIDDYDFRVEGATKAGMYGIIYVNFEQMKNELEKLLTVSDN